MSKFFPLKLKDVSNHIALLSVFWLACISAANLNGQSVPEAINYQAIVRDAATFLPISDQGAYISVEFLDGPDGDLIYQEEFSSIQTGKAGLINLSLGQGNPLINSFAEIPWESGQIWLRLSVDVGNGLNILQETPFNTVPYAFYANSSGTSDPDGDGDSANELIESVVLEGTNLVITEGDQTQNVDLNSLREDEDADPANEIQSLSLNGSALSISGTESTVDLSELPGLGLDSDSDPSNELQELGLEDNNLSISNSPSNSQIDLSPYLDNTDNQIMSLDGTILTLTGDPNPIDLSLLPNTGTDADTDPLNEIQDLELNADELSITNNSTATVVDLSPYLDNTDSQDLTLSGSTLSLTGDGTTVDLSAVPGIGDDADADPANEIQDLSLSGNSLSLSGDGTSVDLSPYLDNTDNQDLTLSGSTLSLTGDGTTVDLSAVPGIGDDADADPANEIQDLSLSGNSLSLSGDGTSVDLSPYLDNTDSQDLTLSGSTLSLTGDGTTVDLSAVPGIGDDADADPANEIQDLSLSGNSLSLSGDGTSVDLSPYLDNTDNQDLTLSGSTLSLTGDGTTVDLSAVPGIGDDADADPANEIQDLSLSGNSLSLSGDGTSVDLSPYLDNTDSQDLTLSGSTLSLTGDGTTVDLSAVPGIGDDADADPANEIQDLSLSGNSLSLSGDGTNVDLTQYDNSALPQNHIFVGDATNLAQEVELAGDVSLLADGTATVTGIQSTVVSTTAPTDGQVLVYDEGTDEWQPETLSGVGTVTTTMYYSIDPLDFKELTDPSFGVSLDKNNAVKYFDVNAPFAFIYGNDGFSSLGAPVHLPHGATVTEVRVYFRDTAPGTMQFYLMRKNFTTASNINETMAFINGSGAAGTVSYTDNFIVNDLIDNTTYNYRFFADFTFEENDNNALPSTGMDQRVYGVIITYTVDQ